MADISLFDDLCTAYDEAYKEIEDYLETYGQLMGDLITNLEIHLHLPEQRTVYISKQGDKTSLREAMYLENGAWHLQLGICMSQENGIRRFTTSSPSGLYYPSQTVIMSLAIRGTPESLIAKLDEYEEEFLINQVSKENDKRFFYDFIADKIKSHYKNMLRYIVEHGEIPERLGII